MNESIKDHEAIDIEISGLDKIVVLYIIIGSILVSFLVPTFTSFNNIWIWGMPKSAFYIILYNCIFSTIVTICLYFAYTAYYEKKVKNLSIE